ncbi:MAG: dihydropteroate synthase [Bacteroidales bacterium]|nr:dihydropteroate synthase [Bacteroidales bacterium]
MHKVIKIMGIVNVNGDSFYPSSRVRNTDEFRSRVDRMLEEGADIIDIGACSSRPGSVYEGVEEEWRRLQPVLETIPLHYPDTSFSIDTFSSEIVRKSFDTVGDFMVNDISAGENDPRILPLVGELNLEYVAMHKRGNPDNMDSLAVYDNILEDVMDYFTSFSAKAQQYGISRWILDPGFGFAKNTEQGLYLLDNLSAFEVFGKPILVGVSRKRMTGGTLQGTKRLNRIAVKNGADILRVHDVKAAKSLLR